MFFLFDPYLLPRSARFLNLEVGPNESAGGIFYIVSTLNHSTAYCVSLSHCRYRLVDYHSLRNPSPRIFVTSVQSTYVRWKRRHAHTAEEGSSQDYEANLDRPELSCSKDDDEDIVCEAAPEEQPSGAGSG